MTRHMGTCRSCGQPVRWATSQATGKPMPLNPVEDLERGNVLLDNRNHAHAFRNRAAALEAAEVFPLLYDTTWLSHHATCPEGPAWRGKTRGAVDEPVQESLPI